MTGYFSLHYYPVFEKGIFGKYPTLFARFTGHIPEHLKEKYRQTRETLLQYEDTITWSLLVGPGFCGATNPGAENIFVSTMVSSNSLVYDSDCLYVNPAQKVFAISDAPGVTTSSRKLFVKLDHYLRTGSPDNLETIINDLNKKIGVDNSVTLSLICFPRNKSDRRLSQALAFIAGDSCLFQGNIFQKRMTQIEGKPDFIGTPYLHLEPVRLELAEGDFFIIVSDGILSLRMNNQETSLKEILWKHLNGDLENFAFNVITSCNRSFEERIFNQVITRFGGDDNVSALLVYPERLIETDCQKSFVLGGYIGEQAG